MTQILQAGYRISQAFWNSRSVVTENVQPRMPEQLVNDRVRHSRRR
jgi:hypothetical protein